MSIRDIESLVHGYTKWIRDNTFLRQVHDNWVVITTPYLDRHNDCLQIYVRSIGNNFEMTDDGYIINDLLNSGLSIDSQKRKSLLKSTLAGFGVELVDNEQLLIKSSRDNFAQKKHNLIQAMLSVNDLFYLASPYTANLFLEDVTKWLEESDIRFTPNIQLGGKSGYTHSFDFVVPKSKLEPERIIQALANPKKDTAENLAFKVIDTREVRATNSNYFVILNDSDKIPDQVIGALKNYEIGVLPWSNKDNIKEKLAA